MDPKLLEILVCPVTKGLRIELLLGDGVLCKQRAIAFQIELRIGKKSLVARHLPFDLRELRFKRPRIDFSQDVAGFG